jgi:hypothetical protein
MPRIKKHLFPPIIPPNIDACFAINGNSDKNSSLVIVHRYTSKDCITRICNRSSSAPGSFKQAAEL